MSLDDELQALFLLCSLLESSHTLFVSLSNSAPDGILKIDSAKSCLLNEETRRNEIGSSNHIEANYIAQESNSGRSKSRALLGSDNSMKKSKSNSELFVITEIRQVILKYSTEI